VGAMSGNVKSNAIERVLAPILILLVTLASLMVLAFLGSKAVGCANAFVDAYSIPNGFHLSDTNGPSGGASGLNAADLAPVLPVE
jgi:hypothetical protein